MSIRSIWEIFEEFFFGKMEKRLIKTNQIKIRLLYEDLTSKSYRKQKKEPYGISKIAKMWLFGWEKFVRFLELIENWNFLQKIKNFTFFCFWEKPKKNSHHLIFSSNLKVPKRFRKVVFADSAYEQAQQTRPLASQTEEERNTEKTNKPRILPVNRRIGKPITLDTEGAGPEGLTHMHMTSRF